MNQKKAKALRIVVRQMIAKGVIMGEPYVAYGTIGMNKTTRRIDPKTPRGLYLRLKRDGLGAVLSGQA